MHIASNTLRMQKDHYTV